MRVRAFGLVLAAMAVAAVPGVASQGAGFFPKPLFGTPGGAAYCYVDLAGFEDSRPDLFCWTPNDGWGVEIASTDRRAHAEYHNHPPRTGEDFGNLRGYKPPAPTLRFGATWSYRCANVRRQSSCRVGATTGKAAFVCRSRSSGLTCTNAVGHGFWIGRPRGFRLF